MSDLAVTQIPVSRPRGGRDAAPMADGVTLYAGALVALESGFVNHWADGANDVFMGILLGGKDRARDGVLIGETDDSPDPEAYVNTSGVTLMHLDSVADTPSQAKVGDYIYCSTSNTDDMTLESSGATHPIGLLTRFRTTTDVDVTLFSMMEHASQAIA